MPRLDFLASPHGPEKGADYPDGVALVDACDELDAPVPFSCRSASCGTCRVEVLAGGELLFPPRDDELAVLEDFASPPSHRLACQARARPGEGAIRVRAVQE